MTEDSKQSVEHPILWSTEVGSKMWRMDHAGSDSDVFSAYQVPTVDILSGRNAGNGAHFSHRPEIGVDIQNHEVGLWIARLIEGNVNYVWGVLSPIVIKDSDDLRRLYHIVRSQASKKTIDSIVGLANSSVRDGRKHPQRLTKRLGIAIRTLRFGVAWLEGRFDPLELFQPVAPEERTSETLLDAYTAIPGAEARSTLPGRPDPEPFRSYLLDLRLRDLHIRSRDRQLLAEGF